MKIQNLKDPISISGFASVSALGADQTTVWDNYNSGQAFFSAFDHQNDSVLVSKISKKLETNLQAIAQSDPNYKRLDRSVLLAIMAARQTVKSAGITTANVGVNLGSSRGATALFESYHKDFLANRTAKTLASPTTTLGNISAWVAQDLRLSGVSLSHSVTCATAMHSVLNGIAWLQANMADAFLVGGSESPLTPFTVAQMQALNLYAKETGTHPCRALDFNKKSNTMILGEGAATAILKKGTSKTAQGHIVGYGWGSEMLTHHTSLSKQADCFKLSMQQALDNSGLESVDVIVMHAPGTMLGDRAELNAIEKIFSNKLPFLTTNKTIIGHTLGASGMMSLEMALLMLANNSVIDPIYFRNQNPINNPIKSVLVNAVGFGGNAVSIIVTK
jgi:3-oxoacyl-(acyl-carrier-protein) synthase